MDERHEAMSDEELEALLRRQPRRLPSPALWERLAAEARRGRKRGTWAAWAGAAAVAVAGVMLVVAISRPRPATDRLPTSTSGCAGTAAPIGVAQGSPAGRGRSAKADAPRATRRAVARIAGSGRTPTSVRVRFSKGGSSEAQHAAPLQAAAAASVALAQSEVTQPAAPPADRRSPEPVAPATAVTESDEVTSSYYLEVSREGAGSALSGSVTRDAWGRVREIEIAYGAVSRDAPLEN